MNATQFWLFVSGAVVLIAIPGPNIFFLVARALNEGRSAAIRSALGIELATLLHVAAAALGLSAIVLSSALAFNVVKYLGAAYLIYLGLRRLFSRDAPTEELMVATARGSDFWKGFLVNLLNPKTALFFFGFFPQFLNPASPESIVVQTATLSLVFFALALVIDLIYVFAAFYVRGLIRDGVATGVPGRLLAGGVYIGLGITATFYNPAHR